MIDWQAVFYLVLRLVRRPALAKIVKKRRRPIELITLNPNCWTTAKEVIQHIWEDNVAYVRASPAVFFIQEHRLAREQLHQAERSAASRGYKWCAGPAKRTGDDPRAVSAGTALMVHGNFGFKREAL